MNGRIKRGKIKNLKEIKIKRTIELLMNDNVKKEFDK